MSWTEVVDKIMTPEEQLLRLIESGGKGEPIKKAAGRFVFWDPRTWAGLPSLRGEKAKQPTQNRFAAILTPRELNLKLVNQFLIAFLVLVMVGIVYNMNRIRASVADLSGQVAAPEVTAGEPQALAYLKPLAEYRKDFEKRDLFSPVAPVKAKKPEPEAKKPKPEAKKPVKKPPPPTSIQILEEKVKSLKLVGISWGKTPVAMIEDTASRETSFLKTGQFINEIQIKSILKDRAVLGLGDAEYDLF
jgi:hypothetical protein